MIFNRPRFLLFFVSIALLSVSSANAELYKWKGEDGRIFYSDKQPPGEKADVMEYRKDISSATLQKASIENNIGKTRKGNKTNNKKVVLYSASWCGVCKKAKAYFESEGILYKEYDIENTRKGRNDYQKLNGTGVPIIMVDKERMNGFSQGRFEKMYDS